MTDFSFVADTGRVVGEAALLSAGTGRAIVFTELDFPSASPGTVLTEVDLEFPADARIETGHFEVGADPVDPAVISTVAIVREASPVLATATGAASVDFGRLVTTGGLVTSGFSKVDRVVSIDRAYRWTGSDWQDATRGSSSGSFPEVATERLLFESSTASSREVVAFLNSDSVGVSMPQTPTGLELLIDGTSSWSQRQGSSPISIDGPSVAHTVSFAVDRTAVLRDALSRSAATGGKKKLRVGLRSTTPGLLTLVPHIGALRVHTHTFTPDGVRRSFDLAEEGVLDTDLRPPTAADVREVAALVRGTFGPARVQPAVGPVLSPDVNLAMTPGRPLLVGVPAMTVALFGKLSGVRMHVTAGGASGCQISGRLLTSLDGIPGDPLPGGELAGVAMGASERGWRTLMLGTPINVTTLLNVGAARQEGGPGVAPPEVAAWLELQLEYGEAICAMTSSAPTDAVAPGAAVVRRLPGGGTKALTTISGLGPRYAATRVVGLPDRDRPIPAVAFSLLGPTDTVGVNPTADSVQMLLTLAQPLAVTGPVTLRAVVAAAGSIVLDTVQVTYRES